jgi:polar amino acid transport system substrate-binding protein
MVIKKCLVGLLLWACSHAVLAEKITAVGFPIAGHMESPTKGHFIDITLAMAKEANLEFDIKISPASRAIETFMQGKVKMLFPALDTYYAPGQTIVRTKGSFNCKEDFIYTKKGQPFYKTLDDVKGKRVGLTQGFPYVKSVVDRKDINWETAQSDDANVEKLMRGRLDAFLVEKSAAASAFENVRATANMQVDFKFPVSQQDVYWAFQNNDEGRALAQNMDAALNTLVKRSDFSQRFNAEVITPRGCKP